ncbi:hypothetical protein P691DRAFT_777752 [Macrolepiota fuliginosa MF-IS2]|uniref:Uncharacterized protein n=1 Tax=Macrolepiota fuliginosa MF-IS2 TaxID=1400762 RepID=A0A9P5X7N5_9AGAR|nr:hypothetical protein P691DRAFT_777752 [Macrolepiota fuliginosa MF-IS2]
MAAAAGGPGSGPYEIANCNGDIIGRLLTETHDLAPKPVCAGTTDPHPIWDIRRLENGRYILSNRGAPTANIDDWLFALLQHQEKRTEWEILVVSEELFHIRDSATGKVWTVPPGERPVQIALEFPQEGDTQQLFKLGVLE